MVAYEGSTPTRKVDRPMIRMVTRKVYLRPMRSPRLPKKAAPKGRTKKPAAKASSAKMKAVVSLTPLKNCLAMIAASEPYRKKSYHSNTVPRDEARMTRLWPWVSPAGWPAVTLTLDMGAFPRSWMPWCWRGCQLAMEQPWVSRRKASPSGACQAGTAP